jgi:DNA polymerase III subunit gamma/tau
LPARAVFRTVLPMDDTTGTFLDEPALPSFAPLPAAPPAGSPYRVLARKYRPRTFDDLIGQDAMVRTLSNAFETGRIPQAWMLTGVRGVGKTTTARILARALNYELPGQGKDRGRPTIRMPELGVHCQAIIDGGHIDVMEIDTASNNGVDNVRQLNESVRYAPVSARYKVYIVDEVHMLSPGAFNAFLKTLEEPPPHAKFVFATTEIRKVPVTILSRCQRFDLRRVDAEKLVAHLSRICAKEAVEVEPEALAAIARAAEGAVRDSLSLLDQAIAHGAGKVTGETVREMLGLADRAQVIDLFEAVMRGDVPAAFAGLRAQYEAGADPGLILSDLASFTHLVTRLKLVPEAAKDPSLSEAERLRGAEFAKALSTGALSRAWQILLKAIPDVQTAPRPVAAAEMTLVRLCYAAELPPPDEALRLLKEGAAIAPGGGNGGAPARPSAPSSSGNTALASAAQPASAPRNEPAPGPRLRRFEDVVALAGERREIALKSALERDVRLVRFEEGRIEFSLVEGASRNLPNEIKRFLDDATGRRWAVALSSEPGAATLYEQRQALERERKSDAAGHPLVQAVLNRFPGAQIVDVRTRGGEVAEAAEIAAPAVDIEDDDEL